MEIGCIKNGERDRVCRRKHRVVVKLRNISSAHEKDYRSMSDITRAISSTHTHTHTHSDILQLQTPIIVQMILFSSDRPTSIGGQGSNLESDRRGRSQLHQHNEAAGYHPEPDLQNVGDRPRYEHLRHRLSGHDSGEIPGHVRPAELASGYGFELSERPRIPLGVEHRLGASGGYEAEYAHRDRPVAGPGR